MGMDHIKRPLSVGRDISEAGYIVCLSKGNKKPGVVKGMVAHAFNLSTWEAESGRSLFQACLVYTLSSKTARAS